MTAMLAYYTLLVLWLPLLWPARRLTGRRRTVALVVIAPCALAAAYELWAMFVWTPRVIAPIRLDIPLISVALFVLYGTLGVMLVLWGRRVPAALLGLAMAVAAGGFIHAWVSAGQEAERLSGLFRSRNALLFAAKFRSKEAYDRYFGRIDGGGPPHPVGHWEARGHDHVTRLVINRDGRTWLFYRCDDTECHLESGAARIGPAADGAGHWTVAVAQPGVGTWSLRIAETAPDRLNVRINDRPVSFVRAPPPVDPAPAPQSLRYLGPFSTVACHPPYARVRQLWLWRGESRLHAVAIFSTLIAGRRADYVRPIVMGEAARSADGWRFAWTQDGRSGTARVSIGAGGASLIVERDGRVAVDAVLRPGALFRDEVVELAPLSTREAWRGWFATVMAGHFSRADIPACPAS